MMTIGAFAALVLGPAACAVPTSPQPVAPGTTTVPFAFSGWQAQMLAELNANRANAGVGPLAACATLESAAQDHTADQAATNVMSHTGSDGSDIGTRADRAGYIGWTNLGENVAYGYTSVDDVMTAWMNSPGHRANILDPAFHDVGLAEVASSSGVEYWTQDFGGNGHC